MDFVRGQNNRMCITVEIITTIAFEGDETFIIGIAKLSKGNERILFLAMNVTVTIIDYNGELITASKRIYCY